MLARAGSGRSNSPVLPGVQAVLDYVWTTAAHARGGAAARPVAVRWSNSMLEVRKR